MKTYIYIYCTVFVIAMLSIIFMACDRDKHASVIDVTLNQTTATLVVGDTLTLIATIFPNNATNKTVTWLSSDTSVATVVDGKITALSIGLTNITVTTVDGNKVDTCVVGVTTPHIAVTGVALWLVNTPLTTTWLYVGDTLTLTAVIWPHNATNKNITWKSSNTDVATIYNGKITTLSAGYTNIIVTTEDGSKTDTGVVVVTTGWSTERFGMVYFATAQTWTIGSQTWSDVVRTSYCRNKTTFDGGSPNSPNIDCRSNPGQKSNLFSWRAVSEHKDDLCPAPWRVPTFNDFWYLHTTLGGISMIYSNNTTLRDKYINDWGGSYVGRCNPDGWLNGQGSTAFYWSQSDVPHTGWGVSMLLGINGHIEQNRWHDKGLGLSLRCVRDN